jgi:hypothetical protein
VTTVRDLLDVAAAELGFTSALLASSNPPGSRAAAAGWSLLMPAAQHLALQTAGPWSKVNAQLVGQLRASRPPAAPSSARPLPSVQRAAKAMGAAGDLLSTRVRTGSVRERQGLLGEGLRLLAASAEVTLHGLGADLTYSATIGSAAQIGDLAGTHAARIWTETFEGPLTSASVPAPALPRVHPGGPLAHAVHAWSLLAIKLDDRPVLSSQDLRGTAVVAAHLLGCVQHLQIASPPDATAPTDTQLRRWIRQWQDVEHAWRRRAIAGPTHQALARASWEVVAEVKKLVHVDAPSTHGGLSPWATSALSRGTVHAVEAVAASHERAVAAAASAGHVLVHADHLAWSMRRPLETPQAGWTRADPDEVVPLLQTYRRLMITRRPGMDPVGRPRPPAPPCAKALSTTPPRRR